MQRRPFMPFGHVSALTLGGGGLGQVWGETTREEAVATARLALDSGITHFDMAPMYGKGEAERVIGEALKGIDKSSLQFTTKYRLGNVPAEHIYDKLNASLTRSLATMGIERVDLFFSALATHRRWLPVASVQRDARPACDPEVSVSRGCDSRLRAFAAGGQDRRLGLRIGPAVGA